MTNALHSEAKGAAFISGVGQECAEGVAAAEDIDFRSINSRILLENCPDGRLCGKSWIPSPVWVPKVDIGIFLQLLGSRRRQPSRRFS